MLEEIVGWFYGGRKREPPLLGMTKALLRDLEEMPPGESMTLRNERGDRFTVMHADDFDHVIQLAGLVAKPVTKEPR